MVLTISGVVLNIQIFPALCSPSTTEMKGDGIEWNLGRFEHLTLLHKIYVTMRYARKT